ncbi:MAG: type II toxin-antitoxin system prevent-host-death family antitoxin [Verrucomicrobiota bacterium]
MKTLNIQEAKTHLSRLVEEAVSGEEIVIAKAGKPLVRLVPHREQLSPRVGGQLAGVITESDDCWTSEEADFDESIASPLFGSSYSGSVNKADRVAEP